MRAQCDLCGAVLTGHAKKFRQFAKAQGWTFIEVFGCLVWKCGACSAKR